MAATTHAHVAPTSSSRLRDAARGVLIVLATLLLIVASAGYWLKSTVLDSDEFTGKVTAVLREPEAAERVGDVLATQALSSGDVQARIQEALPENAGFLTVLLEGQLRDVLARLFSEVLMLDRLQDVVESAIRGFHELVVSTLEGDRERLNVQGDELVLNLNGVLRSILERLGVTPPQRFEDRQAGEVVLVEDTKALEQASAFVRAIDEGVPIVFIGSIVGFGSAVLLSQSKARGFKVTGIGVIVAGVVGLVLWRVGDWTVGQFLSETLVFRMIVESMLSNLRWQGLVLVALGAVIVVAADERSRGWIVRTSTGIWQGVERFGTGRAMLIAAAVAVFLLLFL